MTDQLGRTLNFSLDTHHLRGLKGGLTEQALVTVVTAVYLCLILLCTRWI